MIYHGFLTIISITIAINDSKHPILSTTLWLFKQNYGNHGPLMDDVPIEHAGFPYSYLQLPEWKFHCAVHDSRLPSRNMSRDMSHVSDFRNQKDMRKNTICRFQ